MAGAKVLALVMAGGSGSRLDLLTDERAKPAMPYGGVYRLIDFPLSNCMHSHISNVWIIEQYQPHSLDDHVSNGRPWDLDRTHGGLLTLAPHQGREESGWHQGNADAVFRHKSFIRQSGADVIVVLSSDHVYRLDLGKVVDEHLGRSAAVTMVTTQVQRSEAGRFGVVQVGEGGRIGAYDNKPESPASDLVATEVFVFDAEKLLDALEDLGGDARGDDDRLEDFGDALLPRFVAQDEAYDYRLEGYWRDLGTVASYWSAHMDLLGESPAIMLDDPRWPIYTATAQRPPARVFSPARVDDSLISPGCTVRGDVAHSVLSPGVVVEEGASVRDAIVLHDAVVDKGASVERAIVDMDAHIGGGASLGRRASCDAAGSDITLVGRGARVAPGATVPAGERLARD